MITLSYLLRRVAYTIVTFFVAITFNFLLPRAIPGNPAKFILLSRYGNQFNPQKLKLIESQLHLTGTVWQQYEGYMTGLFHGNLGVSYYYYPATVSSIIATHLPWTLFLLGTSTLISVIVGISIATFVGWRLGGMADSFVSAVSMSLASVPFFWLGLIFQMIFAVMLVFDGFHIFPVAHAYNPLLTPGPTPTFIFSMLRHALLPVITLVLISFPGFTLLMRNTIATVIKDDYILMARAKGLRTWRLKRHYINRNARLPVVTSVVFAFASIVGGAFLVEELFSYQGIGYVLFNAVTTSDYPLIEGVFLVITLTVIVANFLADILYSFLDPRVIYR